MTAPRNKKGNTPHQARQHAERKGRQAEWLVACHYFARGYRIIAIRYKSPGGEADLVAFRGDTLAFIEVKARNDFDTAILAVAPRQRARIESASRNFLSRNRQYAEFGVRFDIAAVVGWQVRLTKDAWRARQPI
ncbi:MAG: YraN family protein [Pseudomonadota bacterium]